MLHNSRLFYVGNIYANYQIAGFALHHVQCQPVKSKVVGQKVGKVFCKLLAMKIELVLQQHVLRPLKVYALIFHTSPFCFCTFPNA